MKNRFGQLSQPTNARSRWRNPLCIRPVEPDTVAEFGDRKARHTLTTGAEAVVSSNPGCLLQTASRLEQAGNPIPGHFTWWICRSGPPALSRNSREQHTCLSSTTHPGSESVSVYETRISDLVWYCTHGTSLDSHIPRSANRRQTLKPQSVGRHISVRYTNSRPTYNIHTV